MGRAGQDHGAETVHLDLSPYWNEGVVKPDDRRRPLHAEARAFEFVRHHLDAQELSAAAEDVDFLGVLDGDAEVNDAR